MAPVGVRERPDRALVVLILFIEFPFDHLPKIVDRSFVSVVDNYCILVWTYCFSSSLSGGTQDSSPILQGSAKPAGFAFFFPQTHVQGFLVCSCLLVISTWKVKMYLLAPWTSGCLTVVNFGATQQFSYIFEVAAQFCEFVRNFTL